MAQGGDQLFGVLKTDLNLGNDACVSVGIRHSHNRTLAADLVAGINVFVCDNLAFSAEIQISRRHTRFLGADFPSLVDAAVSRLVGYAGAQQEMIRREQGLSLQPAQASHIFVEFVRQGVIPGSKLPAVLREWDEPRHAEFEPRTVWSLTNAVTQVQKTRSAVAQMDTQMSKILGQLIPVLSPAAVAEAVVMA
jgi:hypothetical protein